MNIQFPAALTAGDRPCVIWGAGITGRGWLRRLRQLGVRVVGFVDRNPALQGRVVDEVKILAPSSLARDARGPEASKPFVFLAAAVKEQDIVDTLAKHGLVEGTDWMRALDFAGPFHTIDIVGTCNLRCPSCPRGNFEEHYPTGLMSPEVFRKVVGKIIERHPMTTHLALYNWGDPLLHPQLPEILGVAHEFGLPCGLSSNLSIPSLRFENILRAEPAELKVSCSGYWPETYSRTHRGGNVNLVKSNMYRLRYALDKAKSATFVKVEYHVYRHNAGDDFVQMQRLCDELGFAFNPFLAHIAPVEQVMNLAKGGGSEEVRQLDELLWLPVREGLDLLRGHKQSSCTYLNQVNINHDGTVALCCVSYDPQSTVLKKSYLDLEEEEIATFKQNHSLCGSCMEAAIPQYLQETAPGIRRDHILKHSGFDVFSLTGATHEA